MALEFNEDSKLEEKYANGEFILVYFSAVRNVKIDIPTNVPKVTLKDYYSTDFKNGKAS